ncbi:hypothetical protein BCR32DRAFT_324284 [Anaeromyces robustus]|uniref:Uncharacterized protein n=1 Tax=Anaeromyces robustus TaxID=1754192 RepID=A0A1Y1XPU0_9FUNG|nr:hypothetical protein BCR32DRAFT_324284 [Anaeromyces robustus]|eukprot:ORX87757.1 hypothetical protein BCR32DRAFT_324284 [Anaeromyces robustus]
MKYFTIFTTFMVMALSVFALEEATKQSCPDTGVTFETCINQYGGYNPTETTCASASTITEEYNRCLARAYYNLSQCFNFCPNHPSKATYDSFFTQYKDYYTAPPAEQATGTSGQLPGVTMPGATSTPTSLNLDEDANSGSTMLNAFSFGAVFCMIAYLLL